MGALALALPASLAMRELSARSAEADDGPDDRTSEGGSLPLELGEGVEGAEPDPAASSTDDRPERADDADRQAQPALLLPTATEPDPAVSADVVDALGTADIPEVALQAYLTAQAAMAESDPGCGLRWSLLAAIGRVESNHGQFGGAELRADGYGTEPIRGIPLDGRAGVAEILDTDGGTVDGDPVYDRAVGPMQFIPSSWEAMAVDGNDDGVADPDNIFDAALGAALYLCAGDVDLSDQGQLVDAILRYNNSQEYVQVVLSLVEQYETGRVTPLPTPAFVPSDLPSFDRPPSGPATAGQPPGMNEGSTSAYDVPPTRPGSSPSTGSPGSSRPTTTTTRPRPSTTSTTTTTRPSSTTTSSTSISSTTTTSSSTTSTSTSTTRSTSTTTAPTSTTAASSTTTSTTTPTTTTSSGPPTSTTQPGDGCPPVAPVDTTDEAATTSSSTSSTTTSSTTTSPTTTTAPGTSTTEPAPPREPSCPPAEPAGHDQQARRAGSEDDRETSAAADLQRQAVEPDRPTRRTRTHRRGAAQ